MRQLPGSHDQSNQLFCHLYGKSCRYAAEGTGTSLFPRSIPEPGVYREQLLDHIWGYEYIGDTRTVDVHIKRLREKIKDHPQWSLATVWGIGYKFEVKNK